MKNIFIILCCLIMFGCKKHPFDYRNKFIGNYSFIVHEKSYWGIPSNNGSIDTTYSCDGEIMNGSDKKMILISASTISLQAIIYEDGTLEGYWNNNGKGEFASTKEIKYSWGYQSPGSSTYYDITGEKK